VTSIGRNACSRDGSGSSSVTAEPPLGVPDAVDYPRLSLHGPHHRTPVGKRYVAFGVELAVSRDNKTAIELFIAGVRGWEAGLRRQMDDGKSNQD
jgi:hypothetical protein